MDLNPYELDFSAPFDEPLFDSSSDDELELTLVVAIAEERLNNERGSTLHCGSVHGRIFISRDILQGHDRLFHDYFAETPVYSPNLFRRRFRMNHSLFLRIHSAIEAHEPYFIQKRDVARRLGLSSLQKMTVTIRMLAYRVIGDLMDEYVRIGENTAIESFKKFVKAVISVFSDEYLRSSNSNDIARLITIGQNRGFPGMLGSIDCMHWKWKNCPSAWKGQYTGHIRDVTTILEAMASYDLWIWHAFFGLPGSHNDINVLE